MPGTCCLPVAVSCYFYFLFLFSVFCPKRLPRYPFKRHHRMHSQCTTVYTAHTATKEQRISHKSLNSVKISCHFMTQSPKSPSCPDSPDVTQVTPKHLRGTNLPDSELQPERPGLPESPTSSWVSIICGCTVLPARFRHSTSHVVYFSIYYTIHPVVLLTLLPILLSSLGRMHAIEMHAEPHGVSLCRLLCRRASLPHHTYTQRMQPRILTSHPQQRNITSIASITLHRMAPNSIHHIHHITSHDIQLHTSHPSRPFTLQKYSMNQASLDRLFTVSCTRLTKIPVPAANRTFFPFFFYSGSSPPRSHCIPILPVHSNFIPSGVGSLTPKTNRRFKRTRRPSGPSCREAWARG